MEKSKKKLTKEQLNNYKDMQRYLNITGIVIICIFLFAFTIECINKYQNETINSSYIVSNEIIKSDNVVDIKDASNLMSKLNGDYYLYISYKGDSNIYKLEKKLAKIINYYKLNNKFYYVSIDSIKNSQVLLTELNTDLNLGDVKVEKVPTIIYVNKDNEIRRENIITRYDNNLMEVGDFSHLLDINNITR